MKTRRAFLRDSMAVSAMAAIGPAFTRGKDKKQPNLLYVFPDQFRREAMGFWQNSEYSGALRTTTDPVFTPTLDKLAQESIVFTQAVSTCPVCSPHRAMLMSGMYPWQNGVVNNCHKSRSDSLRHDIECFTDVLMNAGYETAYIGKTHWERNEPLFDKMGNYVGSTTAPGGNYMNDYDTYIPEGGGRHGNGYWFQCVKDVHKDPRVYSSDSSRVGGKRDGEQYRPKIYSPQLEADVLIDYIGNEQGQRDSAKPFCAVWSPNPPHNPYDAVKDCDEEAYHEHYEGRDDLLNRPNVEVDEKSEALAKKRAPFYFANVTGVDKQLARILEALEASGEADNTIVVFTSDHGEMMGSQGKFGKLVIYEESFCVPFMIRLPDQMENRLEDLMISSVDIMPTVLGLMGLGDRIPDTVEGSDFSRELISDDWSERPKPQSALFLGYNNKSKGVRTERYSFQIGEDRTQLLFDNEKDPYQMNPIALEDIPKAESDFLLQELGKWLKESNDPWYRELKFKETLQYPA
ncbi:sulfatase [Rubellicoccus peritrichatus]|uniref:Sulfatase n=1 Tax=Rubellicoccus peritrichatus TaxID=3080537 RepID=A0AAQ3LFS2_9BACT|nr:sulfatase [Puniceicoccus sp. CR14]WOO43015.1 sulfatase [Puniceicoccus sp. CR14]